MSKESDELARRAGAVAESDVGAVVAQESATMALVEKNGPLKKFKKDLSLVFALVKAYWNGEYRAVPWKIIAGLAASLIYVVSPIDLVPDVIPFAGFLDDASVIALALGASKMDLEVFRRWLESQKKDS